MNARWQQNGLTVAGGNGKGNGNNQLSNPWGLYIDDDQTIYIADHIESPYYRMEMECNEWSSSCRWK